MVHGVRVVERRCIGVQRLWPREPSSL